MKKSKNKSKPLFFNDSSQVCKNQKKIDLMIQQIYTPQLLIPLSQNNVSQLQNNINNLYSVSIGLNNYKFKNLQSTKLIYSILNATNTIINLTGKNTHLNYENNRYELELNKYKRELVAASQTDAVIDYSYLIYIEEYGIPIDGIFDKTKLNEIKKQLHKC
jgi:hypothetical protein